MFIFNTDWLIRGGEQYFNILNIYVHDYYNGSYNLQKVYALIKNVDKAKYIEIRSLFLCVIQD